jgi:hypothetical protein
MTASVVSTCDGCLHLVDGVWQCPPTWDLIEATDNTESHICSRCGVYVQSELPRHVYEWAFVRLAGRESA